ncbi:MAG: tRNA (adenosine(37)-N6)-dimethylallyltransferase MiaA [Bacteroidales bacterium]|jgi:tRNA dimethylallyltransferase|nr:tRNA (adenosine(37)-N6)-dimethylallyltransferase MiaA [Bacteroidales bacterium]
MKSNYNLITITGATASGKTQVAVALANILNSEIISADSRQIYKNMDIGTGKDISEYTIDGKKIPYHLIDIVNAGEKYNVFEFKKDFIKAYNEIINKNKIPILCGGTGLYIDAILKNYNLIYTPVNPELRKQLEVLDILELEKILKTYKSLHNRSDLDTTKRAIRAIEIENFYQNNQQLPHDNLNINSLIVGILFEREERRNRITQRLKFRLENGLIEEVENLLKMKISSENIEYYGLEYKFVSWYLSGKISYQELFSQLNTAIHQFSKRQMTWFRKMENDGHKIHWIDGNLPIKEKINKILEIF